MTEIALHQTVAGGDGHEYLSFVLGDEHYALDITMVKEIRGYEPVTKIANAPSFIKGVINLRGDIVPIVDLRIKFNVGGGNLQRLYHCDYAEYSIAHCWHRCGWRIRCYSFI